MGNYCKQSSGPRQDDNQLVLGSPSINSSSYISSPSKIAASRVKIPHSYACEVSDHNYLTREAQQTLDQFLQQQKSNRSKIRLIPEANSLIYKILDINATYQGQFSQNGFPHGKGKVYYPQGEFYGGEFQEGVANGRGVYIFRNGSYYFGNFKGGRFHGYGRQQYDNKKIICVGYFQNSYPEGHCKQIYNDNSYFDGLFQKGIKQGYGEYTFDQKIRLKGNFDNGSINGVGLIEDIEKKQVIYFGEFKNGRKQNEGTLRTKRGTMQGKFIKQELNGFGTFCWAGKEKVYEGNFKNSKMHGQGKIYYKNGQIGEGEWMEGHSTHLYEVSNNSQEARKKIEQLNKQHQRELKKGAEYSKQHNIRQIQRNKEQQSFQEYFHSNQKKSESQILPQITQKSFSKEEEEMEIRRTDSLYQPTYQ